MKNKFGKYVLKSDEKARLENLKRYKILYNKSESIFDQLTAITATILDVPIALINFIDQESIWLKADHNIEIELNDQRNTTLCSLAVINESLAVFENVIREPHLMSNPLIAGELGLRFYASTPITTNEGFHVGSVCVVDKKPRKFLAKEQKKLEWVAFMVKKEMNKRVAEGVYA